MPCSRVGCYRMWRTCKSELHIALTKAIAQAHTDLGCSSGVEGGVLADYVAALVTVDDTDANVQRTLIESLQDFLGPESKRMRRLRNTSSLMAQRHRDFCKRRYCSTQS